MNSFNQDEIEDTKGSSESVNRHNEKRKMTNPTKNITYKPKDQLTQTPLKTLHINLKIK
jgi:hypothetical protein